jgi:TolB protein
MYNCMTDEKQNHMFDKQAKLRLMNLADKTIKDFTPAFYERRGIINVPSRSTASKKITFVSYSVP